VANELGAFIEKEVRRAEGEFEGVRSRAVSVTTAAAGLLTLLAGFIAIAAKDDPRILTTGARWTISAALVAFVLATVSAIVVNRPQPVTYTDPADLEAKAREHWEDDGWDQQIAIFSAEYLRSLRAANARSATWLAIAIGIEVLGVTLTAASAVQVVAHL